MQQQNLFSPGGISFILTSSFYNVPFRRKKMRHTETDRQTFAGTDGHIQTDRWTVEQTRMVIIYNDYICRILVGKPEGKRPLGRT
jgi:hypothetical protein